MRVTYHNYGANNIDYKHTSGEIPQVDFHLHDGCEIYFLITGDVRYFIEKKVYPLHYGDLIVTNAHEVHKPSFLSNRPYERIVINFDPEVVRPFSAPDFNLLKCFMDRPKGEQNKLTLNPKQLDEILRLFARMEHAGRSRSKGSGILKLTAFIELLVFINRLYLNIEPGEEHSNIPEKLMPIFHYIDSHLDGDLTLEALEGMFYIDKYYLSRLFKRSTGMNVHQYILMKRISEAKRLLSEGRSVTDACQASGFRDYSHFIRMFKKSVGVPPGKYLRKDPQ